MFGLSRQQCSQLSLTISNWNQWWNGGGWKGWCPQGASCVSFVPIASDPVTGHGLDRAWLHLCALLSHILGISKIPFQLSFSLASPSSGRDPPDPYSSLWPFSGLSPLCPCVSCTEELRTGNSTSGVAWKGWTGVKITSLTWLHQISSPESSSNAAEDSLCCLYSKVLMLALLILVSTSTSGAFSTKLSREIFHK